MLFNCTSLLKSEWHLEMKFIFDLDGTITRQESLPLLADHFKVSDQMTRLTQQAVTGAVAFEESFLKRVNAFRDISVDAISRRMGTLECFEALVQFIQTQPEDCIIATANLDIWIDRLVSRFDARVFSSTASVQGDRIDRVTHILRKEDVVMRYQALGHKVVFIGDGANDATAMERADFAIACGLVHRPAEAALAASDIAVYDEEDLIARLSSWRARNTSEIRP